MKSKLSKDTNLKYDVLQYQQFAKGEYHNLIVFSDLSALFQ